MTLEDEKTTTDVMLKSGAGIMEINAIRRHISQMNGGNLAKRIRAVGADMIGFSIFDVVGYPPTGDISIPTHTSPALPSVRMTPRWRTPAV